MRRRLLFAWELGANYGHVAAFAPVARELVARGWQVFAALRHLNDAHRFLPSEVRLLQAPIWLEARRHPSRPESWADVLGRYGYDDSAGLASLVGAWRGLYDAVQPDVLLADGAPTALLAAQGRAMAVAGLSIAFSQPPLTDPLPPLRPWQEQDPAAHRRSEARVMSVIDAAVPGTGLACLADLYASQSARLINGFRPYDPWPEDRTDEVFVGAIQTVDRGEAPEWPPGDGPRVFAYLRASWSPTVRVLRALAEAPVRCLVLCPDLPDRLRTELTTDRMGFATGPVHVGQARSQAALAVCHSANGTGLAFLQAGVPLLLAPSQAEQIGAARGAVAAGGARLLPLDRMLPVAIRIALHPPHRQAAARFAAAHEHPTAEAIAARVVGIVASMK